jgi:hypothetical protein
VGFVLQPIDEQRMRLVVRGRGNYSCDLGSMFFNFLLWRVIF